VEIPPEQQDELAKLQDRLPREVHALKRVQPGLMHITLRFLGDVTSTQLAAITKAAGVTSENSQPFSVTVATVGAFPNARRARVIWAGIAEGRKALERIAHGLDQELCTLGFARPDKDFSAHITLARVRPEISPGDRDRVSAALNAAASAPLRPVRFPVTKLTVMTSDLGRDGPRYTAVSRHPLPPGSRAPR